MSFDETMHELLTGPLHFRYVLQPLIALLLGLRDGRMDQREGRPPFFLSLFTQRLNSQQRAKEALRQIMVPLAIAVVADSIAQLLIFRYWRLWPTVFDALCIIFLPYLVARGVSNRLLRRAHA